MSKTTVNIHGIDISIETRYAIYMEGIEKVFIGTKDKIDAYLKETLGYSLELITWHTDCITVCMNDIYNDIPLVQIEYL